MNRNPSLDAEKAALRRAQNVKRKQAASNGIEAAEALGAMAGELLGAFSLKNGDYVAGYWAIKTELNPMPLLSALSAVGLSSCLPATPKPEQALVFHAWKVGDPLREGLYGTSEPLAAAEICVPKLLLVPLLAFDDFGYRLGYGGGFYDRTLMALRENCNEVFAVGIGYAVQKVEHVPIGDYDMPLDGILTETGLNLITSKKAKKDRF